MQCNVVVRGFHRHDCYAIGSDTSICSELTLSMHCAIVLGVTFRYSDRPTSLNQPVLHMLLAFCECVSEPLY